VDRPQVSVIVPCFRGEATLAACLRSLLAQRSTLDFEILVVLNASPDRSPDIVNRIARASGGRVRVLDEPTPGVSLARNCGIAAARAPVLLFTDADCTASPAWAQTLHDALRSPDVLLAGGHITGDPSQRAVVARYSRFQRLLHPDHCLQHPVGPFLQTANLAVRRIDAQRIGGFDPTLASGEDADFCWRLQSADPAGRIVLADNAEVTHTHRESVRALFRQYAVYGWSDAALARRHGVPLRWAAGAVLRAGRDALRFIAAPILLLACGTVSLWKRDPLPVAIPLLLLVATLGRRVGQLDAVSGRWPVYEPPIRSRGGDDA
jgi:glycosyltransferase involved in cell wall biosynthesis